MCCHALRSVGIGASMFAIYTGKGNITGATMIFAGLAGFLLSFVLSLNLPLPLPIFGGPTSWIGAGLLFAAYVNRRVVQTDTQSSTLYFIPLPYWTFILGTLGAFLLLFNPYLGLGFM